ncbi:RNA polymerase sigma factor [Salinimicrobium terrae]|uniref:RNA polymerase sigma factor n=1 Tax=Salinimicrobium terrae TaxID=470866 RepID=UPI0003F8F6C0|nr:RNA polymerase sigma factor [Salinimicrobium terrae]
MTLTTTHIDELLEKCRRGDERAQMKIYKKYSKAMYNVALRIVKDSAEAEDIMQECFLKAFDKLETFEGTSTFGAWLKKIVVNHSIGIYNKNTRHTEVRYEDQFKHAADDSEGIASEEEEQNPKVKMILKTMESLKENYRVALTLHLIEGYDYEEICEILNITYANCRTTISRAKESLRTKLLSYEN